MKKILVIAAMAVFSFANAQKGSVLVMGSVGYWSENRSDSGSENKQNSFNIVPKAGYQFHENWTVGIEAGVTKSKQDISGSNVYKYNTTSFGGFLRYSKPLNQTFSAYADLGIGFQNKKETNTNISGTYTDKGDGFYTALTPAILINVGKGFALNFNIGSLGYNTLKFDENSASGIENVKRFSFTFGQSYSIGISKNF